MSEEGWENRFPHVVMWVPSLWTYLPVMVAGALGEVSSGDFLLGQRILMVCMVLPLKGFNVENTHKIIYKLSEHVTTPFIFNKGYYWVSVPTGSGFPIG